MSQRILVVQVFVVRQERLWQPGSDDLEYGSCYQIIILTIVFDEQDATEATILLKNASTTEEILKRLKEAALSVLSDKITGLVWTTGYLGKDQALRVLNWLGNEPDILQESLTQSLARPAAEAGAPEPLTDFSAGSVAEMLLDPILKPVRDGTHVIEIAGVVIGALTGVHPLAFLCAKLLAHDEISSSIAKALAQLAGLTENEFCEQADEIHEPTASTTTLEIGAQASIPPTSTHSASDVQQALDWQRNLVNQAGAKPSDAERLKRASCLSWGLPPEYGQGLPEELLVDARDDAVTPPDATGSAA